MQDATKDHKVPLLVTDPVRDLVESEFKIGKQFRCELRGKEGQHLLHEVVGARARPRKPKKKVS